MHYQPLTDTEIDALRQKITAGIVHFTVVEATEKLSKANGNVMIALKLQIADAHDVQGLVFDWLTSSDKMQWKLKHFMESVGLGERYESGAITPQDCLHRKGLVEVKYQHNDQYGEQLKVVDYVAPERTPGATDNVAPRATHALPTAMPAADVAVY